MSESKKCADCGQELWAPQFIAAGLCSRCNDLPCVLTDPAALDTAASRTSKTATARQASTGLDWRDYRTTKTAAPCRHCGGPTHLLDEESQAAHKVCAEAAATDSSRSTA